MAYEYKGLGFSEEDVQSVEHDISGGVLTTTLTLKDGTKLSGTATLPTTASSADKLATSRTIDGVSFNGSASINHYASCSTEAATAEKTVTRTGFSLGTGARIAVRFSNTNTASNPKLNVNGTGAKSIYYRNSAITPSVLEANRIYEFVYDGAQYELVGDLSVVGALNGSTTPNKTIYAPTTSGSSGQVLKSNGSSSAPTWGTVLPFDTWDGFGNSGSLVLPSGGWYYITKVPGSGVLFQVETNYSTPAQIFEINTSTDTITTIEITYANSQLTLIAKKKTGTGPWTEATEHFYYKKL